jgi:hypothetical protein
MHIDQVGFFLMYRRGELRLLTAFLLICCTVGSQEISSGSFTDVLVIADVHGDSEAFLRSLWVGFRSIHPDSDCDWACFQDAFDPWSASEPLSDRDDVAVVQIGDLVDKGPYTKECIRIARSIEAVIGWPALLLFGNHELNHIEGVLLENAGIANPHVAYDIHAEDDDLCNQTQRAAIFGRDSETFQFMINNFQSVVRLDSPRVRARTLFVHASIDLGWIENNLGLKDWKSVSEINAAVRKILETGSWIDIDRLSKGPIEARSKSFFWNRSFWEDPDVCSRIDIILDRFNVSRIIVGHTPAEAVTTKCNNKIIALDAALSRWVRLGKVPIAEAPAEYANPTVLVLRLDPATEDLDSIEVYHSWLWSIDPYDVELIIEPRRQPKRPRDD